MMKHPQTLHHKVSSAFIVFFTLFTICFLCLIQYGYQKQLSAQYLQQYQYENALIATQVSDILETTESRCNNIIVTVNNLIDFSDSEMPLVTWLSKMRTIFTSNLIAEENISEITIVFSQGEVHKKDSANVYSYHSNGGDLLRYLAEQNIDTTGHYFSPTTRDSATLSPGIYYAKKLTEIDTLAPLGYVILKLDETQLSAVYADKLGNKNTTYYFLDPQKEIVSSDDATLDLQNLSNLESATYLTQLYKNSHNENLKSLALSQEWTLITTYDLNADLQNDLYDLYFFFAIGGIVLLLLYLVIIHVSKRLTNPIAQLTDHMCNLTPTLPQQIESNSDLIEIKSLTNSFNLMVTHYHELFGKMQAEQEAKRLLEMQLLQTQIKPHFLYNTLGSAHCLNVAGHTKQGDSLIKSLVSYYRIVLSNGADWISLEKEFEATERYLEIMSVRYASILSYEIHLPTALQPYMIPKLTLQPLVENAIEHGVKPRRQKAKISIWAEQEGDFILLHVRDDGSGMPAAIFESYIKGEKPSQTDGGFGLKNVADRIHSYYKGQGSLMLNPVEMGTDLVVRIPMQ